MPFSGRSDTASRDEVFQPPSQEQGATIPASTHNGAVMQWIITKVGDAINRDGDMNHRVGFGRIPDGSGSRRYAGHMRQLDPSLGKDPLVLPALVEGFAGALTHDFRLLDDDGVVCFEGRLSGLDQADQEHAFEPLDFAEGDVGATRMQYRKVGEIEWRDL
jgi:hypothetical protein